jgi:hypothetical protein
MFPAEAGKLQVHVDRDHPGLTEVGSSGENLNLPS